MTNGRPDLSAILRNLGAEASRLSESAACLDDVLAECAGVVASDRIQDVDHLRQALEVMAALHRNLAAELEIRPVGEAARAPDLDRIGRDVRPQNIRDLCLLGHAHRAEDATDTELF